MEPLDLLKKKIIEDVFITRKNENFFSKEEDLSSWIFDFRKILFLPEVLNAFGEIFFERFRDSYPFQVGGIEVAAIPLVSSIVTKSFHTETPIHGFFIRKSRKKTGLLRMIEGTLNDEKVILVDDLMNTGGSLIRQVEVLESLGKKVDTVFAILRFRDESYYRYFHEKGIRIESLFTLDDFSSSLNVSNLINQEKKQTPYPYRVEWLFKSSEPNYAIVVPKSAPVIDESKIYFGADNGNLWAINQKDGSIAWKFKTIFGAIGKRIFSSPAICDQTIFFGAYDGNLYAVDSTTGKRKWVYREADWIGSSPCVAKDLNLVFVGLEFGLLNKKGGIAALDMTSGEKKWEYTMTGLTHSSPGLSQKNQIVVCGCNDYFVHAFNAQTGKLLWSFQTEGEVKASFAFDEERGHVFFGSFDSYLYCVSIKSGELVYKVQTNEAIYSTPLVYNGRVYVASLDKNLYSIDIDEGKILWKFLTTGRIFATPEVAENHVYIGSNDGKLYELNPETGENTAIFQATERITNKIVYNKKTKKLFLPTYANEIYCLAKKSE